MCIIYRWSFYSFIKFLRLNIFAFKHLHIFHLNIYIEKMSSLPIVIEVDECMLPYMHNSFYEFVIIIILMHICSVLCKWYLFRECRFLSLCRKPAWKMDMVRQTCLLLQVHQFSIFLVCSYSLHFHSWSRRVLLLTASFFVEFVYRVLLKQISFLHS